MFFFPGEILPLFDKEIGILKNVNSIFFTFYFWFKLLQKHLYQENGKKNIASTYFDFKEYFLLMGS
jgi:hypothetical protein